MKRFHDGRDWFFEKRYGLFFHWGLYSISRFHEQEIYRRHMTREAYARYIDQFNPVKFDPDQWVQTAIDCGMEYMVITAKHIDGFCLWDTRQTAFNVMNTPFRQDIIKLLSDACHRRHFPFGVYYSCADMNQKHYPHNNRSYEFSYPQPGDEPDLTRYMDFVKSQVTELCTQYGELAVFYWDANVLRHKDESVNEIIRKLQPNAMVNNRGYDSGDYATPEREFEQAAVNQLKRFVKPTEAIQSVGMHSWSCRSGESYYSSRFLLQSMDRIFCLGGNYNLNIGPNADGTLNPHEISLLKKIAAWLKACGEAVYGALPASELLDSPGQMITVKGDHLYVHLLEQPAGDSVVISPLTALPVRATLLNTGEPLAIRRDMGTQVWHSPMPALTLAGLPVEELYDTIPVIRLEFERLPESCRQKLHEAERQAADPLRADHAV